METGDPDFPFDFVEYGPYQTSIIIHVQNLVVTSSDETKVLRWDPERGIADTNFSYNLECAQKKVCQVYISIYSTDGAKVYEEWLEQLPPGSYSFNMGEEFVKSEVAFL